jgi:hypothetical protein
VRQGGARDQEGGAQVQRQQPFELLRRRLVQPRAGRVAAGQVDHGPQRRRRVGGGVRGRPLDRRRVDQVGLDHLEPTAAGSRLRAAGFRPAAQRRHHPPAVGEEGLGHRRPEAATAAGDERGRLHDGLLYRMARWPLPLHALASLVAPWSLLVQPARGGTPPRWSADDLVG